FREVSQPAAPDYDATAGKNPSYGADINFYLKADLKDKETAKLTFKDSAGKTVRTMECRTAKPGESAKPEEAANEEDPDPDPAPCLVKAGINRVWWDLRGERSTLMKLRTSPLFAPDVTIGPEGFRKNPAFGRIAVLMPPGTYTVTLNAAGKEFTEKLS